MIKKINKNEVRVKKHNRIRTKIKGAIKGTAARPRLSVFRSGVHIYAQLIDDDKGHTLVSSSTLCKDVKAKGLKKTEAATAVGTDIAKKAVKAGISEIIFDRSGYLYTGRVRALADGARAAGLKF